MIIQVQKLNRQGKYSGELEFNYNASDKLISIPYVSFLNAVNVKIAYWILEDDSVEIKGSVNYFLKGQCSRCLKETGSHVTGEIDAYFIPDGGRKLEEDDYIYTNGVVDLTECVDDAIMLSMPYVLLCDENCEGIKYNGETESKQ